MARFSAAPFSAAVCSVYTRCAPNSRYNGEGVMSGVARQREQHADADQVEMAIGMLRHRVAVIGGESLHARRADHVPMTVGEHHPELFFGERPRSGRSAALPCR